MIKPLTKKEELSRLQVNKKLLEILDEVNNNSDELEKLTRFVGFLSQALDALNEKIERKDCSCAQNQKPSEIE